MDHLNHHYLGQGARKRALSCFLSFVLAATMVTLPAAAWADDEQPLAADSELEAPADDQQAAIPADEPVAEPVEEAPAQEEQATPALRQQAAEEGQDASGDEDDSEDPAEDPEPLPALAEPLLTLEWTSSGLLASWEQVEHAERYLVYRKAAGEQSWTLVTTIDDPARCSHCDATAAKGKGYAYQVKAQAAGYEESVSAEKNGFRFAGQSLSAKKKGKKLTIKWSKVGGAAGYQVQYAKNRLFFSATTKKVAASSTSLVVKGLKKKGSYFVRIRACATVNGTTCYGDWAYSANMGSKQTKLSVLKKGAAAFELRAACGQVMYGYDTLQGHCTDGTYGYYTLYNRIVLKTKIAKVRLSDLKVVKVSEPLEIGKGQGLAYDADKKRLVATYGASKMYQAAYVDPSTLQVTGTATVKKDVTKAPGAAQAKQSSIAGISSIAYNASHGQYVATLRSTWNFMVLDKNMNAVRLVKASKVPAGEHQGIETAGDFILVAMSPKGALKSNVVLVYNWSGKYLCQLKLKKPMELEGCYLKGGKLYAGFYYAYNTSNGTHVRKNYVYQVKGF